MTTGKYSYKRYRCRKCGTEKEIGTNHYGECYSWFNHNHCPQCPPRESTVWECCEALPKGMSRPKPWKMVTVTIKAGGAK